MSKTSGGLTYHDYNTGDGYVYRLWANGSVTIIRSPRGGAGTLLSKDVNPAAWQAVRRQIADMRAGKVTKTISDAAKIALALIEAGKRRPPPASPPADVEPLPDPEPPSMPAIPPWAWGAGAAAVLLLAVAASGGRR